MTKNKSQIKLNIQNRFGHLRIGYWRLFVICILLFGAYFRSIINKLDRHILTQ
jgi:hypothetical protein